MTTSTTARPLPIPLPPTLIPALLASDSSIYPSPLTLSTLTSWITTAPSSTLYYPSSGIAVSLPLQLPYWLLLTSGELKEWELTPSMFAAPGAAAAEVGVHVWHVERWDGWRREWGVFGDVVRQDLGLAAGGRWSALVVTHEGRRMFERRWGGREGAYSGQVVVGGVLREREEWERKGGVGTVEGSWLELSSSCIKDYGDAPEVAAIDIDSGDGLWRRKAFL
ncbi:hypothetical protein BZA05DRAFT_449149 [Tricharina praecox]|uniref:uncharacterized protein n=1 Tax=Tricharina praecox TaxID=43433 RepID=UPI00221E8CC4|nr:uncharacterized protein BZA05DRAFT_449149 [Tricharina praecox]KAI5842371.1 hypothetical protein BZA05DRAFT_449149 [Tricharina praecox]